MTPPIQRSGDRIVGVNFFQPRPEVSFRRACRLLFDPDTPDDEEDGLLMLTELERTGRLTEAERRRLRTRLEKRGASPFLLGYREYCWGRRTPPAQFWWDLKSTTMD